MTISTKAFAYLVAAALLSTSVAHAAGKVRIGFPVQIHTANMMLLQDYAKRGGVDLDVAVMRGYPSIQLALTTNELDIALLGFVNVGLMEEKGFRDQIVVAGAFTGAQNLTLRTAVTASAWKDLEGRRIGTAPNTYADLMFKSSARLGGADLSKIKLISFAPPGGPPVLAAMRDGDIDGFVFWEPTNAEAALAKLGYYSSLDIGDNPTRHINAALLVNADYAAKNRAAVKTVVKALVEATDALNADPFRFAEVAQKGTGSSPEVVKESIPRGKLDYKLYQRETKALMRMIHEAGIIKVDATPAVDRAFDYSFLMEVTGKSKRELGGE
jgi:ABC-type nitrate/sulfonate/bicarbonate transport system substrate-binding protein